MTSATQPPSGTGWSVQGTDGALRPATIYDVARAAGVSHQTVSRLLRGHAGIRPQTRSKVLRALEDLDYRPNLTARSLTTGRSHRIGALTHELDQVGPGRIIRGASVAAREAGYVLDIVSLDTDDPAAVDEALQLMTQHDLAGVIVFPSSDDMAAAFDRTGFRVPAYLAAERDELLTGDNSDLSSQGIPALVDHLAGLGHRTFVHIAGPNTWAAARNRVQAFEQEVARRGLTSLGVRHGDWSAASAYEVVHNWPELRDATAVIAGNDQMALGAMAALSSQGASVPTDFSVTGIDDVAEAAYFCPSLTTISVDFASQGRAAVQHLLDAVAGHRNPPAPPRPFSTLIPRNSSGPARVGPWVKRPGR